MLVSKKKVGPGVVVHTFNPSTWEVELVSEFKTSLACIVFQDSQGYTEKPCLEKPKPGLARWLNR